MASRNAFEALTNMNAAAQQSAKLLVQLNQAIDKFVPLLNEYLESGKQIPAVAAGYKERVNLSPNRVIRGK